MSLHTLAHHLQSAGRGEDKVLVHMTPGEVKGLQSLAMAHGGSLTINPETGLPEAGFLSSILPMVAGFFLGPAGIGLTAMQSALAVGALGTAATGSLGKGFMMGLGAYGGAGLGEGLASAGAANLPATASGQTAANLGQQTFNAVGAPIELTAPIGSTTAGTAADVVTKTAVESGGLGGIQPFANPNVMAANPYGIANPYNLTPTVSAPVNLGTVSPPPISSNIVNAGDFAVTPNMASSLDVAKSGLNTADAGIKYGTDIAETMRNTPTPVNDIDAIMSQGTPPSAMDKLGAGFNKATGSWEGAKEVWNATPKGTGYGLAATGMSVLQAQQEEAAEDARRAAAAAAAERGGYVRPYEFSTELTENAFAPRESTSEFAYFTEPRYIAKDAYKAKEGGLMSLAVGGQVEQMSAENSIGGNTMYPQSQIQTPMYSNPMVQRPMPNDVIGAGIDVPTDRYTGEQKFASGGVARYGLGGSASASASAKEPTSDVKYTFDPATQQYIQTTTTTPADSAMYSKTGFPLTSFGGLAGAGLGIGVQAINDIFGRFPGWKKIETTNPTANQTKTSQTSGGSITPYVPPTGIAAANTSMIPNIQLQPQQSVNQQLGLEAFYPMMEQNLAMRGAQMKRQGYADGGMAGGGYSLGSYSDGGQLLKGPGDGISDSIPAQIGSHQPARLANNEFVIPARIVSEIGNGSTDAGAKRLYEMMDRVQKRRAKTVGKNKVAVDSGAHKELARL